MIHGFWLVALAACATLTAVLLLWTATGLAPKGKGVSPWPVIGKSFLWGPVAGVVFAGACITVDHEAPVGFIATGAILGFVVGPWVSAFAWADTLRVFPRRRKVKGAVDSSPHDTSVDSE